MDYMICYLVSKYLGIFQIFFCYCHLIIFIVDKEHTLYDEYFWILGICFMTQNMVHLDKRSLRTSEHSTWCPVNYEVFHSGCEEQEIFLPNVCSSFISFSLQVDLSSVPDIFLTFVQSFLLSWSFKGKDLQLFPCEALSSQYSLCEVQLLRPSQTCSFPFSLSKTTLLSLVSPSLYSHLIY